MTIQVGEVIEVNGVKVVLRIFDESSKDTLFYNGDKYKGISIREYVIIRRGFRDIVCRVEGEYLDEKRFETDNQKVLYIRKVDVRPIGYFQEEKFYEGVKYLPMIKDPAYLSSESMIETIFGPGQEDGFVIGEMLKEGLPISLPWKRLFNTHIGIFGNTGSGKSNTLAKLYTTLFANKKALIRGKSTFAVIDFNGEYTGNQLVNQEDKTTFNLDTRNDDGVRFPLAEGEFWNKETLAILFKATANTQTPFINRIVSGRERFGGDIQNLENYIKATFYRSFTTTNPKQESAELLKAVVDIIDNQALRDILNRLVWRGDQSKFSYPGPAGTVYFDGREHDYDNVFRQDVDAINLQDLDAFGELIIRVNLQLINDLLFGYVQFEHIQPLLKRIESSMTALSRVIRIDGENAEIPLLTVISLRKCNQEIKKVVPLLLAKHFYEQHKNNVGNPPDRTLHLIIDEAHNILSEQSTREQESWKDYRLELFEEIIKEGRKFGMFLTLASQRPADISPTIMSQIHNFFIHRLVNDKDLFLLDSTISTLDNLSKSMIPSLAKGCCIVTGTSFDLPMVLQIEQLTKEYQPDSEDVVLEDLWS
ncbi:MULTISPECIES: ATP-binding protein [unclassified Alcanivorax]|uniref:ATP-binding protein n=2 Tax=Alcanivorax TaxID=59753 RepID=UPI0007B89BD7|nr:MULTISPECIES: ATP-binding protein [unclassified Alcanivorax]KZX75177.1 nucleotidyltransferase [Alcanivorax sp. HI0013]KZX78478.1 nucleotidyltransferase [Alcanivorax sp. HI0011]KZY20980.1 nucleotidyltransferase [Alcanivorax sp. HI0035]KZX71660.1 nucleotidyltransferase [Alcanivorax sp. HI0003]KZY04767.1 nucleotidyltransferase [Alcanivorax sp. HI0033]